MDRAALEATYDRLDHLDAAGFAARFAEGGTLTLGNQPPSIGAVAIRASLESLFGLLDGSRHDVIAAWDVPDAWIVEAAVTYRVRSVPAPVEIASAAVLRTRGDQLRDVRIYADLAPVMAAAQRAGAAAATAAAALPIRRTDDGARGAFGIERDGRRIAEMTYTRESPSTIAVRHTWVSDELRGQGVASQLLAEAVRWARTEHLRILPLCSYARAAFAREPSLRDVLA
jgi:uncharacterized protein